MALSPAAVDILSFFYPVGNTSAFCMTQELPPEESAKALLLGCGDVRNVLYTIYCDQTNIRKLDFTCCDYEPAILARNLLFYSLLLDDKAETNQEQNWAIYFHFYLSTNELDLLKQQATKLLQLSESLEKWNKSQYGECLRFCDQKTLRMVRMSWQSYCIPDSDANYSKILETRVQASKSFAKAKLGEGDGFNLTGVRSAAPIWVKSMEDIPRFHDQFWRSGLTSDKAAEAHLPNPMFASPLRAATMLHYGVNPLLGFHLSIAYAPLMPASPFHSKKETSDKIHSLTAAAKMELNAWAAALRSSRRRTCIRVVAGDAIDVCRMFLRCQSFENSATDLDKNLPRDFNVIDTSNLIDHLGVLNVLISSSRLLSLSPHATLFTELLVKQDENLLDTGSRFLLGDLPSITLLLGLYPVEYWSGVTLSSAEDANIQTVLSRADKTSHRQSEGQVQCRMSWKLVQSGVQGEDRVNVHVDAEALSELLYGFYQNMFQNEDVSKSFTRLTAGDLDVMRTMSLVRYHRGSFVEVLSQMRTHISTDWEAVISKLITQIQNDKTIMLSLNYIQELFAYLHLHSFDSSLSVLNLQVTSHRLSTVSRQSHLHAWQKWPDIPPLLCVTIKVPRKSLQLLCETAQEPGKLGTPVAQGVISSSSSFPGKPWQNIFAASQMLFGQLKISENPESSEFNLTVDVDIDRWQGYSPAIVSFWVPTQVLLQEPDTAHVSFGLQQSPLVAHTFLPKLGFDLALFRTTLADSTAVFFSKDFPTINGCPFSGIYGPVVPKTPDSTKSSSSETLNWTLNFDKQRKLNTITARLIFGAGPSLICLRDKGSVKTSQMDCFTIVVEISKATESFRHTVTYPVPIVLKNSVSRVARASGYVDVVAPIMHAETKNSTTGLPLKVLPITTPPTCWNIPRVNVDLQPTLNLHATQELQWLISHVSTQMSSKERETRQKFLHSPETCPDPLVEMKDSLFSLFMHYTGLQGQKAKIFGLSAPEEGGVHIIILVSKLKLDVGNQTVFLDAAFLPLSHDILHPLRKFLGPLSSSGELCQIKVTGAELRMWHQIIPLYIERCRTWSHVPACEYKKIKQMPLSLEKGASPVCSCGKGKFPANFMPDLPQWNTVQRYCFRAAISPLFSVSYVEKGFQYRDDDQSLGCTSCGKKSQNMQLCGRCKAVKYCSRECQRQHWQTHRLMCKAASQQKLVHPYALQKSDLVLPHS